MAGTSGLPVMKGQSDRLGGNTFISCSTEAAAVSGHQPRGRIDEDAARRKGQINNSEK